MVTEAYMKASVALMLTKFKRNGPNARAVRDTQRMA